MANLVQRFFQLNSQTSRMFVWLTYILTYGLSVRPSHFVIKSITLQQVKLQDESWYRDACMWLTFQTSLNLGHLDLLSDLLNIRLCSCHFLVKSITLQQLKLL